LIGLIGFTTKKEDDTVDSIYERRGMTLVSVLFV